MSFSQNVVTGSSADGEYVYYNATIVNNSVITTQTTDDPSVYFQDTRQYPLINDVGKYVVSVDNFTLNGATKTLPIFIPQIQPALITCSVSAVSWTASSAAVVTATTNTPAVPSYATYTTTTAHNLAVGLSVNSISGLTGTGVPYNFTAPLVVTAVPSATTFTVVAPTQTTTASSVAGQNGTATYQDPTDVNTTIYTVSFGLTMTQGGTSTAFLATVPIQWIPENQSTYTIVPTTALPKQLELAYYYTYSYTHWVDLMNNALAGAWRQVMYKVNAVVSGYGGTRCPYFEFNQSTGLFSLCQDAITSYLPYGVVIQTSGNVTSASQGVSDPFAVYGAYGTTNTTSGQTSLGSAKTYGANEFSFVGFNTNLEGLITNFDTIYFGGLASLLAVETATTSPPTTATVGATANAYSYTQPSGVAIAPSAATWVQGSTTPVYYPENIVNVNPTSPSDVFFTLPQPWGVASVPSVYYYRETQDFISTGSLWSPIASLVLTTTQIPVRFEGVANPVLLGKGNSGGTSGVAGASQKVLLETPIDAVTADLWRGFIQYKPLVPLFSALDPSVDGLTNLDLRLGWRNRLTNTVTPIQLYNSGTVSFRLRFVRK